VFEGGGGMSLSVVNNNRKKTEVGYIPVDWSCISFSEGFVRESDPVTVKTDESYREIGIRSHGKGIFHKKPTQGEALGNKRVFWVKPNLLMFNIVFAWEQAVAVTSKEDVGFIASHRFPMYNGLRFDEQFALYFFKSQRGKYGLGIASPGGAGRNKTLGQGGLDFLYLPCPPLDEQKKITEILSTWDRGIEQTEKLIAAKQRRKKALMQQLLTGKKRFREFEGRERWRDIKFGEFATLQRGFDLPFQNRISGDAPIYASNGIVGYHQKAKIKAPGVVTGRSGTIGKVSFVKKDFHPLNTTLFVKDFHNNHPEFVFRFIEWFGLERFANGTGVPTLNRNDVHIQRILVPYVDEQLKICTVLNTADKEINQLKDQLAALRRQKQGLMQVLLTGKVRVKVKEVTA
jgi:type I restriction enzyme, S subunit